MTSKPLNNDHDTENTTFSLNHGDKEHYISL